MGNAQSSQPAPAAAALPAEAAEKKKCSPCCVCKETRKARDECLFSKSEDACKRLIEAHEACLRKEGFATN